MQNSVEKLARIAGIGAFAVAIAASATGRKLIARQKARAAGQSYSGANPGANAAEKAGSEVSGFYCNLKALSPEERQRHHALTLKLAGATAETKELADGYAFMLAGEAVSIAELSEWVTAERKCCPFFDFEIAAERDGGPLWLKLHGRDGVKAFIHSEFGIAR
jgi:hypothetical protein